MHNAFVVFGIGFLLFILSTVIMYWTLSVQDPAYKRFTFWASVVYGMFIFDIFMIGVYILEIKLGVR